MLQRVQILLLHKRLPKRPAPQQFAETNHSAYYFGNGGDIINHGIQRI